MFRSISAFLFFPPTNWTHFTKPRFISITFIMSLMRALALMEPYLSQLWQTLNTKPFTFTQTLYGTTPPQFCSSHSWPFPCLANMPSSFLNQGLVPMIPSSGTSFARSPCGWLFLFDSRQNLKSHFLVKAP